MVYIFSQKIVYVCNGGFVLNIRWSITDQFIPAKVNTKAVSCVYYESHTKPEVHAKDLKPYTQRS